MHFAVPADRKADICKDSCEQAKIADTTEFFHPDEGEDLKLENAPRGFGMMWRRSQGLPRKWGSLDLAEAKKELLSRAKWCGVQLFEAVYQTKTDPKLVVQ